MNKFDTLGQLHQLSDITDRPTIAPFADGVFLLTAAISLCEGLALAHAHGLVIGDLSDRNLGFNKSGQVKFFDLDSAQIKKGQRVLPARMGVAEFIDPRAKDTHGRWKFDKEADEYSLNIILFKLLFQGQHPFAGAIPARSRKNVNVQLEHLMRTGVNINTDRGRSNNLISRLEELPTTEEILPRPICDWVNDTLTNPFDKDNRVSASTWARNLRLLRRSVKSCKKNPNHFWLTKTNECPWCRRLQTVSRNSLSSRIKTGDACIVENCHRIARLDSHWCDVHWGGEPPNYQRHRQSQSTSSPTRFNSIDIYFEHHDICGARNKDGSECQKRPLKGNKRCHHHYGQWSAVR